eukprot:scaffold64455_cov19-Tisochrysis_lutea.AAC.1
MSAAPKSAACQLHSCLLHAQAAITQVSCKKVGRVPLWSNTLHVPLSFPYILHSSVSTLSNTKVPYTYHAS